MKIIVTGGAGFIGSNLVDRLITEGHETVILDDFSSGNEKFVNSKVKVVRVDIRDADSVDKAFADFKPEAVFHLAAQIDLRKSIENPEMDYEINVTGSKNILESCVKHGVKRFTFSSSAAVYGDNQNLPIKESEPIAAQTQYGKSKAEIEVELKEKVQKNGIKAVVLRYANVYGPRQGTVGEGGVIAVFCQRLNSGEPLKINGNGEQTRDFVFVDDIVDANLKVLSSKKDFAVYNVSTSKETTINDIAEKLLSISKKGVKVEHSDAIKSEVIRNSLDNHLIKKDMEWSDRINIQEGLEKTWEWFNKNI